MCDVAENDRDDENGDDDDDDGENEEEGEDEDVYEDEHADDDDDDDDDGDENEEEGEDEDFYEDEHADADDDYDNVDVDVWPDHIPPLNTEEVHTSNKAHDLSPLQVPSKQSAEALQRKFSIDFRSATKQRASSQKTCYSGFRSCILGFSSDNCLCDEGPNQSNIKHVQKTGRMPAE